MTRFGFFRGLLNAKGADKSVLREVLKGSGCSKCFGRGFVGQTTSGVYITCGCVQKQYKKVVHA